MDNDTHYDIKLSRYYTLYNLFYVLFKRWKMITILFCCGFLSMYLSAVLTEPVYKQVCKIFVRHSPNQEIVLYRDLSAFTLNFRVNPMANYMEIADSRIIGEEVVKRHKLDERLKEKTENPVTFRDKYMKYYGEVFASPITVPLSFLEKLGIIEHQEEPEPDYFQMAVDKFLNETLNLFVVVETAIIIVEVYGEAQDEAADMASYVALRMVEQIRAMDVQEADTALEFSREQYSRLSEELMDAKREVISFLEKNDVIGEKEEKRFLSRKLEVLEIQETTGRTQTEEMTSRVGELKERLSQDYISPNTYQTFISQLSEAEKEAAVQWDKLLAVKDSIKDLKDNSHRMENIWIELDRLEREADVRKQQMGMLRGTMEKLVIQRINRLSEHDFIIIEEPALWKEKSPSWPIFALNIVLGIFCGLFLALFVPFLIEFWRETYTISYQVEKRLNLPVISTLPELPSSKSFYSP